MSLKRYYRLHASIVLIAAAMGSLGADRSLARQELDHAERFRLVQEANRTREKELLNPRSERAASALEMLSEPVDLDFGEGVPLADILDSIRESTESPGFPEGLPIVVDERGLESVGKSLDSTCRISLVGVPLRTTLRLILDQHDLIYWLHPDGYFVVTADFGAAMTTRMQMLLLFEEIRLLRGEVRALKGGGAKPD